MSGTRRRARLLVPALLILVAGGAAGYLARTESSPPADVKRAESEFAVSAALALPADGHYAPFATGSPLPFEPKIRETLAAPVTEPATEEWSRLSNLKVQAMTIASVPRESEMPAPAGFDESLSALERSRLVAARSVENEPSRRDRGPGFRVGLGTGVCIPGIDE